MKKAFTTGHIVGIAGAVVLGIASFLPWARVELLDFSETVSGMDGDGIIQIVLAVIALILLLTRVRAWIPLIFAVLAAAVGVIDLVNLMDANAETGGLSELAYGIYLIQVGWVALLVGCIMALVQGKSSTSGKTT